MCESDESVASSRRRRQDEDLRRRRQAGSERPAPEGQRRGVVGRHVAHGVGPARAERRAAGAEDRLHLGLGERGDPRDLESVGGDGRRVRGAPQRRDVEPARVTEAPVALDALRLEANEVAREHRRTPPEETRPARRRSRTPAREGEASRSARATRSRRDLRKDARERVHEEGKHSSSTSSGGVSVRTSPPAPPVRTM